MLPSNIIIYFQSFIFHFAFKDFWYMWIRSRNCVWNAVRVKMCKISENEAFLWNNQRFLKIFFWVEYLVLYRKNNFSKRANCLCRFHSIEQIKSKWRSEHPFLNDEFFCEVESNNITKTFVCPVMDTFLIHILEIWIRIINVPIELRRSQKLLLQRENYLNFRNPILIWSWLLRRIEEVVITIVIWIYLNIMRCWNHMEPCHLSFELNFLKLKL